MPQVIGPLTGKAAGRSVKTLLMFQMGLMVMMAVLSGVVSGEKGLYSAFLAGVTCILSTLVFALIAFRKSGAKIAPSIVRAFYRAEAIKWLVTAVLLMLIFAFIPIAPSVFFATFCVMQLSYWVVLGLFKN